MLPSDTRNAGNGNRRNVRPVILSAFGPPSLACIRSWGSKGYAVGMVCIRSKEEPTPRCKYLEEWIDLPQRQLYTQDGIRIIHQFLEEFKADGIVCISENIALWLNSHQEMFLPGFHLWFPPNSVIQDLLSKRRQVEVAQRTGFDLLPTFLIHKDAKSIDGFSQEHFPLCLRPTREGTTTPRFKVHLVYSRDELRKYIDSLIKIEEPIIAQPFRSLPNLVVHGARTIEGHSIGLQAFLVERKFEGLTLTIRPTGMGEKLRRQCIKFTDEFGVTGNYHFEFLTDKKNGAIYFLELNNRLGGTTAKVFALGYDEPLLALQAYGVIGDDHRSAILPCPFVTKIHQQSARNRDSATDDHQPSAINHQPLLNKTASSKQALLKYLFYTLKNKLTPLDYPQEPKFIRVVKTIYGIFRYRDDVLTLKDWRGSFAHYFGSVKNRIKVQMI